MESGPSPALHPKCLRVAPVTDTISLTVSGASSHPRLTPTHHPFCQERFLLPLGSMKSDSFKCLCPGLGNIFILEPIRAPRRRNVRLARCGGSPLKLFGLEAGSMSSQREAEALALGMRTGVGSGCRSLTAPCTAAGSEAHGRKGLIGSGLQRPEDRRQRHCPLTVLPQWRLKNYSVTWNPLLARFLKATGAEPWTHVALRVHETSV